MNSFVSRPYFSPAERLLLILWIVAMVGLPVFFTVKDAIMTNVGQFEGSIDPVVSDFEITTAVDDDGKAVIFGTFNLLRADQCDFEGIDWFLMSPSGRAVLADVTFPPGVKVRDNGPNLFGPWTVDMSVEQMTGWSEAVVHHQCYWKIGDARITRPWETITHLYP